jgi:PAS domain-containing protein
VGSSTMVYIFIYNVVGIKSDFLKLKSLCPDSKFILIASSYCLRHLSTKNRSCFDDIHQIARDFHHIDYDNVKQIVNGYVEEYGSQNIRLMTNEDSTQIDCAKVREFYGIPGESVDNILPFVNKVISKNLLNNIVKIPRFLSFDKSRCSIEKENYLQEIITQLGFPMFAKPIDLVSSIGTHKIDDLSDLKNVASKISADQYTYEIDEFIDGDLFHCDLILYNGTIKFFMPGKYAFHLAKFSKGFPMGSIPVTDEKLHADLYAFTHKVIQKLNFKTGACHLEVFLEEKSQEFVFLEVAARTPGASLPRSYEIQYGINIEEWHYLAHMNLLNNSKTPVADKFAGWITFPIMKGEVVSIKKPIIDIKHEFVEYVHIGQILQQPESLLDTSCGVVFWDKNIKNIQDSFEKLKIFKPLEVVTPANTFFEKTDRPSLNLENHFEIMEELFNIMPYVFWKDRQGRYLGCNLNNAKAFHFSSAAEFVGKTVFELLEDLESAKLVDKNDNEIMNSGKVVILEETLTTPEGIKTYLSQKQPLYDNKGNVIGLLGYAMDITQTKEQERLIKEQNEKLTNEKHQLEIS